MNVRDQLLDVANRDIAEKVGVLAAAHASLVELVAAADSHVELAGHCERARKVIARIEGYKERDAS